MPLPPLLGFALAAAIPPHDPQPPRLEEPFPTARAGEAAILRFSISDAEGRPIPGRLTFVDGKGEEPELFVRTDPASGTLAVRKNVAYSLGKPVSITVPPGRYTVHATHGIEWSRATTELALEAGKAAEWSPRLVREIDTPGWVSGDFHLHTLTYSGHGDANLNERLISLLGEGVEFAVATDHNHQIDYGPTVRALGAERSITTVTGNEVSTEIGHFNAFPLDPARPPVDHRQTDANELFRRIRLEANPFGVLPVVQVNHPRYAEIDYFGLKRLDPVAGTSDDPAFSLAFDSVEVLNANATWGWEGIERDDRLRGTNLHSVLHDWFRLLDRGERIAAVGNSDSHTVHYDMAGFPRNYVRLEAEGPGAIDPRGVAEAVKGKALFTTTGPFVRFEVEGASMGGSVAARARPDGSRAVSVSIGVRSASWIPFDRVHLVVNGEILRSSRASDRRRHEEGFEQRLTRDAWACVLVEGDASLWPIVGVRENPTRAIAVTNPVWIDADGDGRWTSPWEQAKTLAAASGVEGLHGA
ncbi:MAG: CehA/McbA family metallohydrolase, partial [Planctomycetota bacterium]